MKSMHPSRQLEHSWRKLALLLATLALAALRMSAQVDTTANDTRPSTTPNGTSSRSASLTLLVGLQRGFDITPEGMDLLVGVAPTIALGEGFELAPEVALWHLEVYYKGQWNLKLALPVRWFPWSDHAVSPFALAGLGVLFAGGAFTTFEAGAGLCWRFSTPVSLTADVRTHLGDLTSEESLSMLSVSLGLRLTPAR